jgi:hypothetical protein
MRRFAAIMAVVVTLVAAGCSKSAQTAGVAALDSRATDACAQVRQLIQARATGALSATALRARVGAIYNAAQSSENPLIRARAVALYADATQQAAGGEALNLDGDLAAMNDLCAQRGVQPA